MTAAVVFDMDGVIVDSERVWDEVREQYVHETGGAYSPAATRDMMGMSSVEWSRYMADELGVPGTPQEINAAIVVRMLARYGEAPPLIPGAAEAVRMAAGRWPLAIASSSNPELIEVVLRAAGLREPVTTEDGQDRTGPFLSFKLKNNSRPRPRAPGQRDVPASQRR